MDGLMVGWIDGNKKLQVVSITNKQTNKSASNFKVKHKFDPELINCSFCMHK